MITVGLTTFLFLLMSNRGFSDKPSRFAPLVCWLSSLGVGGVLILLTNPCIVSVPSGCSYPLQVFGGLWDKSFSLEFSAPTLVFGRLESPVDPAFWLLPAVLFTGMPIFVLVLAFLGAVFGPENLRDFNEGGPLTRSLASRWVTPACISLVCLQAAIIPIATILTRDQVHDMQRHHLYTYPAISALAGIGFSLVLNARWLKPHLIQAYRWVVGVGGVLLLFVPLYEGARLWPYNYVYVNPIASIGGIEGRWETDYWAVSLREALEYVPKDQPFSAVGPYWAVKPFMADRGSSPQAVRAGSGEVHVIQAYRPGLGWNGLPVDCRDIVKIERNIRGHVVPIAQTGICPESLGLGSSYADILAHDP
jgi:hypothetical protein